METNVLDEFAYRNGTARDGQQPAPPKPAPTTAAASVPPPSDPLPRRRDVRGGRLPSEYTHGIPPCDDVSLRKTPLAPALTALETVCPAAAASLEYYHDHRLLEARRSAVAVAQNEAADRAGCNAAARARNEQINQQIVEARTARAAEAKERRDGIDLIDKDLTSVQKMAAVLVTQAGGQYNPYREPDPNEAQGPMSAQAIAARRKLPYREEDKPLLMARPLAWTATLLVGALLGTSLGLMTGSLYLDSLGHDPFLLLFWTVIGAAAAAFERFALLCAWARVAELSHTQAAWYHRVASVLAAGSFTGLVIAMDGHVGMHGLLSSVRLQTLAAGLLGGGSSRPGTGSEVSYLLASILVSVGYVTYCAFAGYFIGRKEIVSNEIAAHTPAPPFGLGADASPLTRAARVAVAAEDTLKARFHAAREENEKAERAFETKIARLEAQRLPLQAELSDSARQRIQDACDDYQGALSLLDYQLSIAFAQVPGGFHPPYLHTKAIEALRGKPSLFQRFGPPRRQPSAEDVAPAGPVNGKEGAAAADGK